MEFLLILNKFDRHFIYLFFDQRLVYRGCRIFFFFYRAIENRMNFFFFSEDQSCSFILLEYISKYDDF